MSATIYIYTDGSCLGNPGPGGCASVFIKDDKNIFNVVESHPNTTNNRMELLAVINSFKYIPPEAKQVIIYSDANYCVLGINDWLKNWLKNGWRNSKKLP